MRKEFVRVSAKTYEEVIKIANTFIEAGKYTIAFNAHRTSLEEDFIVEIEWLTE